MTRHLSATLMLVSITVLPLAAQAPDANAQQQLMAAVKEVQTQQAQIADNQKKIEAKLAEVAEAVRVARLFGGRDE